MNRAAVLVSVLVLCLLSVLPMARTFSESFVDRTQADAPRFTLRHYTEAFVRTPPRPAEEATTQETPATRPVSARWRLLGNSALIAGLASLVALLLGVPYALLVARTDAPGRGVLGLLFVTPLLVPPLLVAFAWTFLWGFEPPPQFKAPGPASWGGVAAVLRASFLLGLSWFPLVVLFARRALAQVPASLEEAARLAGGPWLAMRRVTLPLAAPGILAGALFVFLFALNDFSLVDYLNFVRPTADRIGVYPFESFTAWSKSQGASVATALGAPLALLGVLLLFAIGRLVGRGPRAATSGEWRAPAAWKLGAWRVPAALGAVLVVVLAVAVPLAGLARKAGGLENYRGVWQNVVGPSSPSREILWTLWFSVGGAVLVLPLGFVLGHHAARSGKLRWLALALVPLAVPPIFLGAGYLQLFNTEHFVFGGRNPFLDQDGPRLASMLLLVAKYAPFAIVAFWAAFLEVDPRLEEAAASAGVKPLDRALGVLLPLVKPAAVLAFGLVLVLGLREIDTIVLLTSDTIMRRIYTMVHYLRDSQVAALCIILVVIELAVLGALALLFPAKRAARPNRTT